MKKEFLQSIKVILLGLVLAFGINFAMAAWTGPTSAPTGGNVDGPITTADNVSGNQIKYGGVNFGKKVSIGKISDPTYDLEVEGYANFKGIGVFGGVTINPAKNGDPATDGELFSVYDNRYSADEPVFSVDTSRTNGLITLDRNADIKKDLLVRGRSLHLDKTELYFDTAVRSNLYVGYGDQKSTSGKYTLDLDGTTNIGLGGTCTLTKSDVNSNKACPDGTYLSMMNPDTTDTSKYAICRSFSPKSSLIGKDCYSFPPLNLALLNIYEQMYDTGISLGTSNYKIPYCVPKIDVSVSATGGQPSYTYGWEYKGRNNTWTGASHCANKTTCTITFKDNRSGGKFTQNGYPGLVRVNVTDSVNTTLSQTYYTYFANSTDCK